MREIVPHQLWVGNAGDLRDPASIFEQEIEAIIDLAVEELPAAVPRSLIYCRFPLNDGENESRLLLLAMKTAVSFLREQRPFLICCSAGMSRSPAIAAGALAVVQSRDADTVLEEIVAGHPHDVSPVFWQEVRDVAWEMVIPW